MTYTIKAAVRNLKNLFTETEEVELVPTTADVNPQAVGQMTFSVGDK
jgi:hypothetical protein